MVEFDTTTLRNTLGAFATGVTVVTARAPGGHPVGITVNSFTAVSLEPPLVLWNADRSTGPNRAFNTASHYAVHVLHADQESLARHFARDRDDKFADVPFTSGIGGLPLLNDFTARFQCRVERRLDGGDHVMLLGRVLALDHRPAEPLVFHAGGYRRFTGH